MDGKFEYRFEKRKRLKKKDRTNLFIIIMLIVFISLVCLMVLSLNNHILLKNVQQNYVLLDKHTKLALSENQRKKEIENNKDKEIENNEDKEIENNEDKEIENNDVLENNGYLIEEGDSVVSIAEKFNISVSELMDLNELDSDFIYAGHILKVQ